MPHYTKHDQRNAYRQFKPQKFRQLNNPPLSYEELERLEKNYMTLWGGALAAFTAALLSLLKVSDMPGIYAGAVGFAFMLPSSCAQDSAIKQARRFDVIENDRQPDNLIFFKIIQAVLAGTGALLGDILGNLASGPGGGAIGSAIGASVFVGTRLYFNR